MEGCRHSSLEILSTRGTHRVVFADAAKAELRRYVLVSKAEIEVGPSLEEENFHWIFALAPGGGTSIVISIQSQYWVFASPCAYLTFGWLPADDPKLLRLPEGSAEFLAVTFEAGWQSEDSVAFIPEVEEIPAALRGSYKEFYHAYSEIDGYQLSFESKGFKGSALTYGESHFKPILDILQRLEVGPKDILLDLGSGTGRVVLAAALACPFLKLCRGIELLPSLHGAAQDALGRLCGARIAAPVELICGDLVEEDWSDATVVFAMSLCFPEEMMEALEQKFRQLRPGSYVILMHCFMGDASCLVPHPREGEHAVRLEMSFGETPLYIFKRRPVLLDEID